MARGARKINWLPLTLLQIFGLSRADSSEYGLGIYGQRVKENKFNPPDPLANLWVAKCKAMYIVKTI